MDFWLTLCDKHFMHCLAMVMKLKHDLSCVTMRIFKVKQPSYLVSLKLRTPTGGVETRTFACKYQELEVPCTEFARSLPFPYQSIQSFTYLSSTCPRALICLEP